MRYRFFLADVFTREPFGGNQLAVFPDARGLDDALMQRIARELNFSETVFVLPPRAAAHARRLRIFTPATELRFAGHPTLGAAHVLASIGVIPLAGAATRIVFEEEVGPVSVTIFAEGRKPAAAQLVAALLPEAGPPPPPPEVLAALLSLEAGDLESGEYEPQAWSCGVPFLFVPLKDRSSLGRARVDGERWRRHLSAYWAPHLYLISFDPELPDSHVRARMFAPAMGIPEDPATGAAAAALGGYLGARQAAESGNFRWLVEQGFEMGRPSRLEVEIDKAAGQIEAVRVGGASVMVADGTMEVPGVYRSQ